MSQEAKREIAELLAEQLPAVESRLFGDGSGAVAARPITATTEQIQAVNVIADQYNISRDVAHILLAAGDAPRRDQIQRLEGENAQLRDGLKLIAGQHCTSYVAPFDCRDAASGRTRGAQYYADAWCDQCIAAAALGSEQSETQT